MRGEPAGTDQSQPGDGADDDAHRGRDEVVLERILDQENDAEEERETAQPGDKFHAEECFPVDGRLRWFWCGRLRRRCGCRGGWTNEWWRSLRCNWLDNWRNDQGRRRGASWLWWWNWRDHRRCNFSCRISDRRDNAALLQCSD